MKKKPGTASPGRFRPSLTEVLQACLKTKADLQRDPVCVGMVMSNGGEDRPELFDRFRKLPPGTLLFAHPGENGRWL